MERNDSTVYIMPINEFNDIVEKALRERLGHNSREILIHYIIEDKSLDSGVSTEWSGLSAGWRDVTQVKIVFRSGSEGQ